jgi:hypothetical protein
VIASVAGQLLIPIPVVGEMVGAIIVSTVCDQLEKVCRGCLEMHRSIVHISDNAHEISSLANKARAEIEVQRQNFQNYTKQYNSQIQQQITVAFQTMRRGIEEDSYETTSDGLEMVANVFNETTTDLDMDWLKASWKGGS